MDRLAPKRNATAPAAWQRRRRDAEIVFGGEVSRPRAATQPRRQAWLRIFGVQCSLPCDPPVGGHSCNGGMIPRFPPLHCGISVASMSAMGQERRSRVTWPTSALALKADIGGFEAWLIARHWFR